MYVGVTDHIWTIGKFAYATFDGAVLALGEMPPWSVHCDRGKVEMIQRLGLLASARKVILIGAIICGGAPASAQQTIKILTPTSDSCAAFVKAFDANEEPLLLALAGWATGYLSGFAQGTGIDFLRQVEPGNNASVILRLKNECRQQPQQPMSIVLEKMSREMIAGH